MAVAGTLRTKVAATNGGFVEFRESGACGSGCDGLVDVCHRAPQKKSS